MTTILKNRLFWPALILAVMLGVNAFTSNQFIAIQDGHLFGTLIDILRGSAPLILVALGMTLVIATGGIDLSVGSVMAISGAVACLLISDLDNQNSLGGVLIAIGAAILVSLAAGLWNGTLVAVVGIQPIIATLILMVAGRGLAQLFTEGQIINVQSGPYSTLASGFFLALPVALLIAAAAVALTVLLTRRTALGLLLESVGGSPTASRLAGISARRITVMVYVVAGAFAGLAGLIASADIKSADSISAGNLIELDAILAVVIGGTALIGGRFSIAGTVLGAIIIQTLKVTVVAVDIPAEANLLFKSVVVVALCLSQSPDFRAKVFGRFTSRPAAEKVGIPA
ncbi:ABC transporter permease [Actinoplanes xinjiangensis]|jgi:ribose/xylose/arabinose/galactoside ABC-type transport system permease subunit|uniref:Simple sugar transport system permease protein n=1 Tax=Actinoplanes xinjiangensis TaxID=512350 RepID=A0A316GD68_9ACTN|nr:ABC transporter permease [Actinoplanes xinjiangensis]PWK52577.1 simple sugar transport system permease protein [Actinoplanes xinjiangensis]GIF36724.1 sugar ABC transporter permease [Actinoplanes xinjiangensis]